ncbi:MAG: cell surface protein [Lachnospiraceae bacterium]|nr:cell surface protein [Lachnospiraceae bacterium]
MKKNVLFYSSLILFIIGLMVIYRTLIPKEYVKQNQQYAIETQEWYATKAYVINQKTIIANIDSRQVKSTANGIYMNEQMMLMIPLEQIKETFDCAVHEYMDGHILIEKGNQTIKMYQGATECEINGTLKTLVNGVQIKDNKIYIPVDVLCNTFGYQYNFDVSLNQANIVSQNAEIRTIPYRYSYEETGRAPIVSNQGSLGTCWAFASLTSLASTLMPKEEFVFSVDHMSMNNSFNLGQLDGGDYTMAMAYLLSWQGPVLESEDPYGDGETTEGLTAAKHVQEVQIIEAKDYETIKKMVFKYGGVQSSFYASVLNKNTGNTKYYNPKTNSYCYIGDEKPNHDIVIIGWDDNYPKENFNVDVEGNGAFLCRNSWGADFGDNGDFYVSYYDTNIGVHNVVYTRVEDADNYDNIYQTDLCGFVGQLGYGEESAYFANAYTPQSDELLKAVGFYATGIDTEYSIYLCEDFKDVNSLSKRSDPIVTGTLKNSGYYTIEFETPISLPAGKKYAVIVRITTPNSDRPVAVEYAYDKQTSNVVLEDGEGYVSLKGISWDNTESSNLCNVCLKVYTNTVG